MKRHSIRRRGAAAVLCLTMLLALMLPASASTERLFELVQSLQTPVLFQVPQTDTFTVADTTFYRITVPQPVLEAYSESEYSVEPGSSDAVVGEVKSMLETAFGENYFVSYSQLRTDCLNIFDDLLEVLVETVYEFCGLEERSVRLDALTVYLLENLQTLSDEMIADIYTVYKYHLISRGIDGTVWRSGSADGIYYYAQTDSDWNTYPFPNPDSEKEADDVVQNRSCGVMSLNMVVASYLHHEIDPLELVDFVLDNGYRISDSGVDDTFMAVGAAYYGIPTPTIYYADEIDWSYIQERVSSGNCLAIVHEYTGTFTSNQHYMVLTDYTNIGGVDYFLMADPYEPNTRYNGNWDQLLDPQTDNDGLIYATTSVISATCSAVILFDADCTEWDVVCTATGSESIWGGQS